MSAMLIASHPRPVREAIERYRRALDEDPVRYLVENNRRLREATLSAAAAYLGADPDEVALTDSTTMGIGLVYNGLRLRRGQELLTTADDYFVTHEALRLAAERYGASIRRVSIYDELQTVTPDEIADRLARAIRPRTRVLAVTWVHSGTGLKLPIAQIAERVAAANEGRDEDDRVLLCVDAVHGFGVEDVSMRSLGADFFIAGCHKWLFGPRGTGITWAPAKAWAATRPFIPSFTEGELHRAWRNDRDPRGPTTAAAMTPGGFKTYEHRWALAEAFEFHADIGKQRVAERTHTLANQVREGLAAMKHIRLVTPRSDALSAGLICFEVDGIAPPGVVRRLLDRDVIATVTPYAASYARLAPSIRNTPEEIDQVLRHIRALA